MKRKVISMVIATLLITSVLAFSGSDNNYVSAASSFQKINFANGTVIADSVNVRQGASTNYKVVCVLKKGQQVKVFGKLDDWYAVYETHGGCVGAIMAKYIKVYWPKQKTPAKKTPPAAPAPVPKVTPKPGAPATQTPTTQTPTTQTPPSGVTQEQQQLLDLVNKARASAGVGPLAFDMKLMKVATEKANDMVKNNYFSHQSPTYGSPFDMMRQFGVTFKSAGENIAGNQTVQGAFDAWMKSEGHRKNILNGNFDHCGFGIVPSPTYGKMLVQMFIKK